MVKSKSAFAAPARPRYRHSSGGITKTIRQSYGKPSDWFSLTAEVKERDRYRCVFCLAKEEPDKGIWHDVHHLRELSQGGTNSKSNLATTCKTCHAKRHRHLFKSGYKSGSRAR